MSNEYISYSQSRGHKQTSALGYYLQTQTSDLIQNYTNQKQNFAMGEMIGYILARSLIKSFEDILQDMFD